MAVTATISLNPSTVTAPGQVAATLTISNSSSTPINIINVVPYVTGTPPVLMGLPPTGPGMTMTVPATGTTLVMVFSLTATAPIATTYPTNPFAQGSYPGGATITPLIPLANPTTQTITVGCLIYLADGTITTASTASLTINGPVVG